MKKKSRRTLRNLECVDARQEVGYRDAPASKDVKFSLLCNEFKGVHGHSEEVHLNDPAPREGRAGELALQPGHPPHHYGGRQCPGLSFYSFRENYIFIIPVPLPLCLSLSLLCIFLPVCLFQSFTFSSHFVKLNFIIKNLAKQF